MSRARGGSSLTTRPPIEISPPVIISSPAIIRRSVDLPQPDGPTNTTNSPERIARSIPWITCVSPYALTTLRSSTSAMSADDVRLRETRVDDQVLARDAARDVRREKERALRHIVF